MSFMLSLDEMEIASLPKVICDDASFPLQFELVNKDFEDFKTAISKVVKNNLSLLDEIPLPKHLKIEELRERFQNEIKSDLQKDRIFEKSVEINKYAKNMYSMMNSYFREVFDYHKQKQKRLSSDMFCISKMFLNSDLPMPFMRTVEDSLLYEIDSIEVFVKRIRYEQMSLVRYRNNRPKFGRVCDSHNSWANKFNEQKIKLERLRVKLIWYVDFNNSANLNEILEDKIIKTSLLDKRVLFDFINTLQSQVLKMEKLNASMTKPTSFLPFEINEGTRAIHKIMHLLS